MGIRTKVKQGYESLMLGAIITFFILSFSNKVKQKTEKIREILLFSFSFKTFYLSMRR